MEHETYIEVGTTTPKRLKFYIDSGKLPTEETANIIEQLRTKTGVAGEHIKLLMEWLTDEESVFETLSIDEVEKIEIELELDGRVDVSFSLTSPTVSYSITSSWEEPNNYLGCIASCIYEIGGNDLTDGGFNRGTWNEIMADIKNYERLMEER